jgi:CxxC motif-containing protein (DUF1111 family)
MVVDPENGETRLGRFGYKAGTFSVKHQVASAFNTDMGVMTSMISTPDCGSQQASCGNSGSEIADEHVDNLVKYVSLLGVGARRDYANQTGETILKTLAVPVVIDLQWLPVTVTHWLNCVGRLFTHTLTFCSMTWVRA